MRWRRAQGGSAASPNRVSAKMPNPCGILTNPCGIWEGRGFDKSLRKSLRGFANPGTQIPTVFANFQIPQGFEKGDLQFSPCRVLHTWTTTVA